MLYTAKGSGALLVPIAATIAKANGWDTVFMIAMSFNLTAAVLALVVLKPLRARHFAISKAAFAPPAAPSAVGDHHHRTT
jgi:OFA family oxalate/formate antiporter-like MFS transporter